MRTSGAMRARLAEPGGAARRGTALLLVTLVILMLSGLALAALSTASIRSQTALSDLGRAQALDAAESGVALTMERLMASEGAALDPDAEGSVTAAPITYTLKGGSVTVTTSVVDKDGQAAVRVLAAATVAAGGATSAARTVEVFLGPTDHEAFYKAVFIGNERDIPDYVTHFGPGNGNPRAPANDKGGPPRKDRDWDESKHQNNADYIDGDVYVNGTIQVTGQSNVFGDLDATGAVVGRPVSGNTSEGVKKITPPDLAAQDYDGQADLIVEEGDSLPRWLGAEEKGSYYGSVLGKSSAHDNPYFHLGQEDGDLPFKESDSGKLVVIKGNLWIHSTSTLVMQFPETEQGVHVTIVVEGNVFVADDVEYSGPNDGLLIIAKQRPDEESYTDLNGNYRYDDGEPIIGDASDGYQGSAEGSGNIFFGDPRFGTGGVTDGYLYAQNNVHLINQGTDGDYGSDDRVWGVRGFLSAGGIMELGKRKGGRNYENFRVRYDERFKRLDFKGVPGPVGGGGMASLAVKAWRELPPGAN